MEELFSRYGLYLWLVTLAFWLVTVAWLVVLHRRLNRTLNHFHALTTGVEATTLPDILQTHVATVDRAMGTVRELSAHYELLDRTLRGAVQHVGLVRYNPFGDTGGDQSFSLALLNAAGDGLVVSSLFARERTRVYAKPITAGRSTYHLSDEEEQAILISGAPLGASLARSPVATAPPPPVEAPSASPGAS